MKVFTVGQVAKICKVAPRTVSKWFDSGRLKGYRTPGSQDLRIPREYLVKFMSEHGMPLGDLEEAEMKHVLLITQDQVLSDQLREAISGEEFKLHVAASGFEAGIQAEITRPDCVVVDFALEPPLALQICEDLRCLDGFSHSLVFVLLPEGERPGGFDRTSINDVFKRPFEPKHLIERLQSCLLSRAS